MNKRLVGTHLDEEAWERFKEFEKKDVRSKSEIIRKALEKYLDESEPLNES